MAAAQKEDKNKITGRASRVLLTPFLHLIVCQWLNIKTAGFWQTAWIIRGWQRANLLSRILITSSFQTFILGSLKLEVLHILHHPPNPTGWSWSCPALSGDARTGDVKLILHYVINCIADSSILSLLQPSPPLLIPSLLSVTVTLPLILSSNTPTEVLYPPVISYQLWLPSLWSSVGILAPSRLPLFSKRGATCMRKWKGEQVLTLPTTSVRRRKKRAN